MGLTTLNSGHNHEYSGSTSESPDMAKHVHHMNEFTGLDEGHNHRFNQTTEPAIYTENGHYHYYKYRTSDAFIPNTHAHTLDGNTSVYKSSK
jgi:hypothetical protein